jgi:MFS family permease
MTCGIAPLAAVTVYSVEGLAGLGGRLALGVAADRLGVKRVLIAGLVIQALAAFAFISAARLGEFYAVAALFGFAYGGVMPLYAVLAREYFGQRILGAVFGAAAMVSSLGMAIGPAIGGWIFDTFGQYTWMYVYSGAIGLGASPSPSPSRLSPSGQSTRSGRSLRRLPWLMSMDSCYPYRSAITRPTAKWPPRPARSGASTARSTTRSASPTT